MSERRCVVVGAAPADGAEGFYRTVLGEHAPVIAADAAGEWCARIGRVPDVVVGDFDSAESGAQERLEGAGARVVTLPVAKDVSDLEECVSEARRLGVAGLDVCAAFGGRVDHTLAAVGTVMAAADLVARILEPTWTGWALDARSVAHVELSLPAGTLFSVLSPGGARGVTISGAAYPLRNADLGPLSSLGVSNAVSAEGPVRVSVGEGAVLVIALH